MRNYKQVNNKSHGENMPEITFGELANTNNSLGPNTFGAPGLNPNAVGVFHEQLKTTAGHSNDTTLITPDPEVKVRKRRRNLTKAYKLSILHRLDTLKEKDGAVGELLRREGLYSATVSGWRKQRDEGLLGQQRGRKPFPEELSRIQKLESENHKLREKVEQYQLIIEAQKKISEILRVKQDNIPPMPNLKNNKPNNCWEGSWEK